MQKSRRDFVKNAAIVAAGTATVGATVLTATTVESSSYDGNGVVVGNSKKKEILYKKTTAWEDFYKQAK